MRFRPSTLPDALLVHDVDEESLVVQLTLLGRLDSHRWWLSLKVVRVVQVTRPDLTGEVLGLWVSKVIALIDLLRVRLALLVALVELLGLATHPS